MAKKSSKGQGELFSPPFFPHSSSKDVECVCACRLLSFMLGVIQDCYSSSFTETRVSQKNLELVSWPTCSADSLCVPSKVDMTGGLSIPPSIHLAFAQVLASWTPMFYDCQTTTLTTKPLQLAFL